MNPSRAYLFFFVLARLSNAADTGDTLPPPIGAAPMSCKVLADSMAKSYDANDPTYLTWDIPATCDSASLYSLYYYQGLGNYLLENWGEAARLLNHAKEIGGPRDEEILYQLWNANLKLQSYPDMESATLELHQRYPNSFFLMDILDGWKSVKQSRHVWNFEYDAKMASSSNAYLNQVFTHSLRASTAQTFGKHRLRENGTGTLKFKGDEKTLQGLQGDVGGQYEYQGLSILADYGAGYQGQDTSDPLLRLHHGLQSRSVDSNWNFHQGRLSFGYTIHNKPGWDQSWNLNLLELSQHWKMAGLNHSETVFLSACVLLFSAEVQKHWVKAAYGTYVDTLATPLVGLDETWDGMTTLTASATPLFYWGKHSLLIGPTYYFSQSHYTASDATTDEAYEHSLVGSCAYGYDLKKWLSLNFDASFGVEYNQSIHAGYQRGWVYGLDAGLSLSF